MARYILTRAFYSIITLWLLVTIVFGMVRLTGDPVKMYGEVGADKAYLDELRRRWGLLLCQVAEGQGHLPRAPAEFP